MPDTGLLSWQDIYDYLFSKVLAYARAFVIGDEGVRDGTCDCWSRCHGKTYGT